MKNTLDFIIIGAQKAGTTSLFEYLRQHPALNLPPGKEAPFFSHEEIYTRGWEAYLRKTFAFADSGSKWGTVTPQYMVGGLWEQPNPFRRGCSYDEHTVPSRIRECVPDVRLIAILRDPAERARSQHKMAQMNEIDNRSFARAIDELLRPDALEMARREPRETTGYVVWGEYGRILDGYFAIFPKEQILVLFTEELENNPDQLLQTIFEFLDVEADYIPDNIGTKYRVGATGRRFSWVGTDSWLNPWTVQHALTNSAMAKRVWHALPEARRRQADRVFADASYRLDLWNRRAQAKDKAKDPTLERLREHYEQDAKALANLLGRELPWRLPREPAAVQQVG